jgi:hypothetical protein
VDQKERLWVGAASWLMDEMNVEAVEVRLELIETVQFALMLSPVVTGSPVFDQLFEISEISAIIPSRIGHFIGKPRAREPGAKVGEYFLGNCDLEWFNLALLHDCSSSIG